MGGKPRKKPESLGLDLSPEQDQAIRNTGDLIVNETIDLCRSAFEEIGLPSDLADHFGSVFILQACVLSAQCAMKEGLCGSLEEMHEVLDTTWADIEAKIARAPKGNS
jgi:hypothetical protein